MSIQGSRDYCYYCRKKEKTIKLYNYKKSNKKICQICKREIEQEKGEKNKIEKRFSKELEKFLLKICVERKKTLPHSKRYKEKVLLSVKEDLNLDAELQRAVKKYIRCKRLKELKYSGQQSKYLYYSEKDLMFIREEKRKKDQCRNYILTGKIALKELYTIIR